LRVCSSLFPASPYRLIASPIIRQAISVSDSPNRRSVTSGLVSCLDSLRAEPYNSDLIWKIAFKKFLGHVSLGKGKEKPWMSSSLSSSFSILKRLSPISSLAPLSLPTWRPSMVRIGLGPKRSSKPICNCF